MMGAAYHVITAGPNEGSVEPWNGTESQRLPCATRFPCSLSPDVRLAEQRHRCFAMTALRQKLIDELELRGLAPQSKYNYVSAVRRLAAHYQQSPDQLTDDQIKAYLLYLIREKQRARATMSVVVSGLRFFYAHVLHRSIDEIEVSLPRMRGQTLRPQVYSIEEMEQLLSVSGLNPKHRALLMTTYAAGLRVSEVCRLKPEDVLSSRLQIRVVQGKGRKDRYTALSPRLLAELRDYWRKYRPQHWLFPSQAKLGSPLTTRSAERVFDRAVALAGLPDRGGIHSLRHSFATHLLEAGVSLPVLQRLMGHSCLSSTAVYLHISRERLCEVRSPLELVDLSRIQTAL